MDTKSFIAAIVSLFIAGCGLFFGYRNTLKLNKRKDRLDRIDRQLRELYGPLYALTETAEKSWLAFRSQLGRPTGSFWRGDPPPSNDEKSAWCLWMQHVLMPLNLQIERAIIDHSDLLDDNGMPECFLELVAHIASYKAVLKGWDAGDYSRYIAIIDYPDAVNDHIRQKYLQLQSRQRALLD